MAYDLSAFAYLMEVHLKMPIVPRCFVVSRGQVGRGPAYRGSKDNARRNFVVQISTVH